jgi:hypothetical protein
LAGTESLLTAGCTVVVTFAAADAELEPPLWVAQSSCSYYVPACDWQMWACSGRCMGCWSEGCRVATSRQQQPAAGGLCISRAPLLCVLCCVSARHYNSPVGVHVCSLPASFVELIAVSRFSAVESDLAVRDSGQGLPAIGAPAVLTWRHA